MSEVIITLGLLIEHLETECRKNYGTVAVAKQLLNKEFPNHQLDDRAYFSCLRATLLSDGSLEGARKVRHHLRDQARSHKLRRNQKLAGVRPEGLQAPNHQVHHAGRLALPDQRQ